MEVEQTHESPSLGEELLILGGWGKEELIFFSEYDPWQAASESSECPHTIEYLIGFDVCERETDTHREKQIDIETDRQRDREDMEL